MNASTNRTSEFFHAYARDFNAIYGNSNTFVNRLINRHFRASMRMRLPSRMPSVFRRRFASWDWRPN